jgi:hypothetical protein
MDGEGCSKKDVPFSVKRRKRPGSLRRQSKEERGLATFWRQKDCTTKSHEEKSSCLLRCAKCMLRSGMHSAAKMLNLCIKLTIPFLLFAREEGPFGHLGFLKNRREAPMESWSPRKEQTPALHEKFLRKAAFFTFLLFCECGFQALQSHTFHCQSSTLASFS